MIFYFSGTGNSKYIAEKIGGCHNNKGVSISKEMRSNHGELEYYLKKDEIVGFVYPVYAWAPPRIMLEFISRMKLHNFRDNYIFSIATCGDNVGNTMEALGKVLKSRGLVLNSGFSISMPNNYIISFDVDPKDLQEKKLKCAEERIKYINKLIKERKINVFDVEKGPFPGILTGVINPLFNRFAVNTKMFYATDDCTGCGLCEKVCNTGNITVDKKPSWGSNCTQCLACIHCCPQKAVQYGKSTINKGRYKNPNVAFDINSK